MKTLLKVSYFLQYIIIDIDIVLPMIYLVCIWLNLPLNSSISYKGMKIIIQLKNINFFLKMKLYILSFTLETLSKKKDTFPVLLKKKTLKKVSNSSAVKEN